jgi:hypothetical protein
MLIGQSSKETSLRTHEKKNLKSVGAKMMNMLDQDGFKELWESRVTCMSITITHTLRQLLQAARLFTSKIAFQCIRGFTLTSYGILDPNVK